jgi:hypothetical protein
LVLQLTGKNSAARVVEFARRGKKGRNPMYSGRNYTTLGEKIVSVVGTVTLGLILIGLFYTYRMIEASFL